MSADAIDAILGKDFELNAAGLAPGSNARRTECSTSLLKSLHIVSVVLFLGNIITGVFWKLHADRTGDLRARAQALDGIIASDRWFTVPGVSSSSRPACAMALLMRAIHCWAPCG